MPIFVNIGLPYRIRILNYSYNDASLFTHVLHL